MWEAWVQSLGCDDSLEKGMATHSNIFSGDSHGQRNLAGCSPWGHKELDTTEWPSTHACMFICWWSFSLIPCLGFVNSAAMNTEVYVSFQTRVFCLFWIYVQEQDCPCLRFNSGHNSFPLQLQLLLEISKSHSLLKLIREQRPGEIKVVLLG